jgi:hypothetical protein
MKWNDRGCQNLEKSVNAAQNNSHIRSFLRERMGLPADHAHSLKALRLPIHCLASKDHEYRFLASEENHPEVLPTSTD